MSTKRHANAAIRRSGGADPRAGITFLIRKWLSIQTQGETYLSEGEFGKALTYLQDAWAMMLFLSIGPSDAVKAAAYARIRARERRTTKAASTTRTAPTDTSSSSTPSNVLPDLEPCSDMQDRRAQRCAALLAECYRKLDRPADAKKWLACALACTIDPDRPLVPEVVYGDQVVIHHQLGDPDSALVAEQKLLAWTGKELWDLAKWRIWSDLPKSIRRVLPVADKAHISVQLKMEAYLQSETRVSVKQAAARKKKARARLRAKTKRNDPVANSETEEKETKLVRMDGAEESREEQEEYDPEQGGTEDTEMPSPINAVLEHTQENKEKKQDRCEPLSDHDTVGVHAAGTVIPLEDPYIPWPGWSFPYAWNAQWVDHLRLS